MKKETFTNQLGFVLTAAGCAIGLANIYRFPYLCGRYGGALFMLLYLACVVLFAVPLLSMEAAIGRSSRASAARALETLRPDKPGWRIVQPISYMGTYVSQMFYAAIVAQMLYFAVSMFSGNLKGMNVPQLQEMSAHLSQSPLLTAGIVAFIVLCGFAVCFFGVRSGVERVNKIMLGILFLMMIALSVYSATLPGAAEGLKFYLSPKLSKIEEAGFLEVLSAAFGQAFFSLGMGAGSICVFGSYMPKDSRIIPQVLKITALDTAVALLGGFIIFPACFTYGIDPAGGPDLIIITMPAVFNQMNGGRLLGTFFFVAIIMACFSTIVTTYENIVACTMDLTGWKRRKAVLMNVLPLLLLCMPAVLGMSVWSNVRILGRSILDAEDFIVSNNLMPLGALGYLVFCINRRVGWGWDNFMWEANTGEYGMRFPAWLKKYCTYALPVMLIVFWLTGYVN